MRGINRFTHETIQKKKKKQIANVKRLLNYYNILSSEKAQNLLANIAMCKKHLWQNDKFDLRLICG